jgi:hypothetical protein
MILEERDNLRESDSSVKRRTRRVVSIGPPVDQEQAASFPKQPGGLVKNGDGIGKLTEKVRHEHTVGAMVRENGIVPRRADRLNVRLALAPLMKVGE